MGNIEEEKISKLLKDLPQEELPEGFSFALRQKLKEEIEREHQDQESRNPVGQVRDILFNVFRKPQYALAAAAVLLALVISPMFFRAPGSVSVTLYSQASKQLAVGQVALLRVEFRAAKDINDVTFKIELPDGVMFVSAYDVIAESKALAFHGNLEKQKPIVIPVAIKLTEEGRKVIKVKATELGEKRIVLQGRS